MILTCPSCETQYFADDSTIGESGRTVKCAACGHNWFVRPEAALAASTGKAPAAHEVRNGAVKVDLRLSCHGWLRLEYFLHLGWEP